MPQRLKADIPITLQANETIDYKFLPYDKFYDFVQSEAFALPFGNVFRRIKTHSETYVSKF